MRSLRYRLLPAVAALLLATPPASAQVLAKKNWAGSGITVETWWAGAVMYEIDPLSFQDSDGDGFGDLRGITQRLDYLQALGVDAILLSPFELRGHGTGESPFDPTYGTEEDLDHLVQEGTRRKMRVLVDLPLSASRSPAEVVSQARFWLSRGVAGLRLVEDGGDARARGAAAAAAHGPELSAAQVEERVKPLRALCASFAGERTLIWDLPAAMPSGARNPYRRATQRTRHASVSSLPAAAQMMVDGRLLQMPRLSAGLLRQALMPVAGMVGVPVPETDRAGETRSLDRYGNGAHDVEIAKVLAAALLAGPGAPLLYFGQEIGVATTPAPIANKPAAVEPTPMQWGGDAGFTAGVPWIDMGRNAQTANVALEDADADSLLNWYRRLSALRHEHPVLRIGSMQMVAGGNADVAAWVRQMPAGATTTAPALVVCNLTSHAVTVSVGAELRRLGLTLESPMMHTLASSQMRVAVGAEPVSGPVSVNAIALPPFSVYVGELARSAGLESAPAPVRRRSRSSR